jgi:nitrogen-specific signal transduction histidine kinase
MAGLVASTLGPRIDVRVELPDDLPPALADANQLEMAVLNLAVNARDAMPDAGVLDISAGLASRFAGPSPRKLRHGHSVRLTVRDTGVRHGLRPRLPAAVEPILLHQGHRQGHGLGSLDGARAYEQLGGGMTINQQPARARRLVCGGPISAVAVGWAASR